MTAPALVLSAHTISGVMPGDPLVVRHDLAARLAAAAGAGFDGLCLHMHDYARLRGTGWDDAGLRGLYDMHAMSLPAIEFLSDWHHGTDMAHAHRDLAFRAAQGMGATVINAGIDALADAARLDDLAAPLHDLCLRADDLGLRIALEPVAWGQGATLDDALELVARTGGKAGLVIDIWHLAWRGIAPAALADVPPAAVLGLQISDSVAPRPAPQDVIRAETLNRKLCGDGALDIAGYLHIAASCGWTAPVAVEVMSPALAQTDVANAARQAYDTARPFVTMAWSK